MAFLALLICVVCIATVSTALAVAPAVWQLFPLLSSRTDTHLTFAPNTIGRTHICFIIFLFFAKWTLGLLHLVPSVKPASMSRSESRSGKSTTFNLPHLTVSMPLTISVADLDLYSKATKARNPPMSGPNLMFFMAAISEPVGLLLLAKWICPIQPLGGVMVRTRLDLIEPELCERIARTGARGAKAVSRLDTTARRVKRGAEFDITVEVLAQNCEDDAPRLIFKQVITILQFMKSRGHAILNDKDEVKKSELHQDPEVHEAYEGTIDVDAPSRWAGVCQDYNPIHTSVWAAKLFGFTGKIAHGSMVAAQLSDALYACDDTFRRLWSVSERPMWLEVSFKRPLTVPTVIYVRTIDEEGIQPDQQRFQIFRQEKVFIDGLCGIL